MKILEFMKKKKLIDSGDLDTVIQVFQKTSSSKSVDFVMVLSRHPYDMAGMSTGRGWISCMNLEFGSYKEYVKTSMMSGGMIAYLCKPDDTTDLVDSKGKHHKNNKINVQHPLGRCLVKPFWKSTDEDLDFEEPNFILRCSTVYGTFYSEGNKNSAKLSR